MELVEVRRALTNAGFEITQGARLPNNLGSRIDCAGGEIVLVYDSGKVVVQGTHQTEVRVALGLGPASHAPSVSAPARAPTRPTHKVFVVYGHDDATRDQLELMLRRWNLEPLILDLLPSGGDTIIEKLERYTSDTRFAVVLATPDDLGCPRDHQELLHPRVRQNVVLELGMLLAKLGRAKVAILLKSEANMEPPSDIDGLIYIPFVSSLDETKERLARELANAGIPLRPA